MKLDSLTYRQKRIVTHYSALCFANLLQFCCKIHSQKLESLEFTGLFDDCRNTTWTNSPTTLTVFCGGNQGDCVWFSGLFRYLFLLYASCIWGFGNFCYHGVITKLFL